MTQLTKSVFDEWVSKQDAMKKVLPEIGSVLSCEYDDDRPHLSYDEARDLLSFSCTSSSRILDDNNNVAIPYWVLSKEGVDIRGTLRAIVTERFRDMWKAHRDIMEFKSVKVIAHAKSGKSVIVEFVL